MNITAQELQRALKGLSSNTMQEMLEAEFDDRLGYSKYDYKNKITKNSRNGTITKKVLLVFGEVDIATPREHEVAFDRRKLRNN
jgi:transposase-like protein